MAKVTLRTGQLRRLGRLSAKNPARAENVAERMVERRSRVARGQEYLKKNVGKLMPEVPEVGKKGVNVKKKMVNGGSLKPVDKAKNPGLAKLPTAVRNKMGYQKNGGKNIKKAMDGTTTPSMRASRARVASERAEAPMRRSARAAAAATRTSMKNGGKKAPKKMMGGGRCKYGC